MAVSRPLTFAFAALLAATVLGGCGDADEQRAVGELEAAGKTAAGNVEHSDKIMADTYDEERKQGEGAVEAAGDAYNAVLDAGRE